MAFEVYLGDEEFHSALEVGTYGFFCAIWNLVAIIVQPGDQSIGLLC